MWSFTCRVWFVCRMDDGRLLDYLMNHDELMEEKVAFYIRDTMEALQYLHNCRVAHLDIKVRRKENDAVIQCPGTESSQLHRQGAGAVCTPKRWSLNGQALSFRPIDQRKDSLTCGARSFFFLQTRTYFLASLVCSQELSGFNEGEGGCLRQEWDVTSTWLKGNYKINPRGMVWAHTCTRLATKLPEQSWLVPRQLRAGKKECVSPSHLQQCSREPKARGGKGAGEEEVGRAGRGKGKQQAALCCRAREGNSVGNTPRERFRGRTSCVVEKKFKHSLTWRSVRLAQLVLPFVSTHGRRHCTVLDSALYCCPQLTSQLSWITEN